MRVHRKSNPLAPLLPLAVLSLFAFLLTACGGAESSYMQEGEQAPEFTLPTAQGGEVSLADYKGEQPVLLYFHMAVG